MRRYWPLLLFFVIFAVAMVLQKERTLHVSDTTQKASYQRIVSLSPSITETVFALGLGSKLVAVTKYCEYPAQVKSLPKVGGYIDTNLESVLNQQPDLVIMLEQQQQLKQQLNALGIDTLTVDNSRLPAILDSIQQIGEQTGHQQQAQKLLRTIDDTVQQVQNKISGQSQPRVLISIAHYSTTDNIEQVYIAGQNDFYNDLIELAGGLNVYQNNLIKVPTLNVEGIIQLDPDVIIDVFPEADDHKMDLQQVRQQWQNLTMLNAVKHQRIHLIEHDFASIPGPRIFNLLPIFGQILHPQLDWTDFSHDHT